MVKKMVAAGISSAVACLFLSAGQGLASSNAPSCAAGSVDGPAPQTAMCFGTMFPQLSPFHYSDQAAADLAATMENRTPDRPGTDRGTSDDSATLPSEYTYLGQFIDHNLDFDETSQPTAGVNPSSLRTSRASASISTTCSAEDPPSIRSSTRPITSICWSRGHSARPRQTASRP